MRNILLPAANSPKGTKVTEDFILRAIREKSHAEFLNLIEGMQWPLTVTDDDEERQTSLETVMAERLFFAIENGASQAEISEDFAFLEQKLQEKGKDLKEVLDGFYPLEASIQKPDRTKPMNECSLLICAATRPNPDPELIKFLISKGANVSQPIAELEQRDVRGNIVNQVNPTFLIANFNPSFAAQFCEIAKPDFLQYSIINGGLTTLLNLSMSADANSKPLLNYLLAQENIDLDQVSTVLNGTKYIKTTPLAQAMGNLADDTTQENLAIAEALISKSKLLNEAQNSSFVLTIINQVKDAVIQKQQQDLLPAILRITDELEKRLAVAKTQTSEASAAAGPVAEEKESIFSLTPLIDVVYSKMHAYHNKPRPETLHNIEENLQLLSARNLFSELNLFNEAGLFNEINAEIFGSWLGLMANENLRAVILRNSKEFRAILTDEIFSNQEITTQALLPILMAAGTVTGAISLEEGRVREHITSTIRRRLQEADRKDYNYNEYALEILMGTKSRGAKLQEIRLLGDLIDKTAILQKIILTDLEELQKLNGQDAKGYAAAILGTIAKAAYILDSEGNKPVINGAIREAKIGEHNLLSLAVVKGCVELYKELLSGLDQAADEKLIADASAAILQSAEISKTQKCEFFDYLLTKKKIDPNKSLAGLGNITPLEFFAQAYYTTNPSDVSATSVFAAIEKTFGKLAANATPETLRKLSHKVDRRLVDFNEALAQSQLSKLWTKYIDPQLKKIPAIAVAAPVVEEVKASAAAASHPEPAPEERAALRAEKLKAKQAKLDAEQEAKRAAEKAAQERLLAEQQRLAELEAQKLVKKKTKKPAPQSSAAAANFAKQDEVKEEKPEVISAAEKPKKSSNRKQKAQREEAQQISSELLKRLIDKTVVHVERKLEVESDAASVVSEEPSIVSLPITPILSGMATPSSVFSVSNVSLSSQSARRSIRNQSSPIPNAKPLLGPEKMTPQQIAQLPLLAAEKIAEQQRIIAEQQSELEGFKQLGLQQLAVQQQQQQTIELLLPKTSAEAQYRAQIFDLNLTKYEQVQEDVLTFGKKGEVTGVIKAGTLIPVMPKFSIEPNPAAAMALSPMPLYPAPPPPAPSVRSRGQQPLLPYQLQPNLGGRNQ